jgi:hypothetical protein
MTVPFFRLLKSEDKESALLSAVASLRTKMPDPATVFQIDPAKFFKVPNSPFAYWVGDEIRELFTKYPPFEGEGRTVKQGLATADDFRFVRTWWEVPAEHRLDAGNGPDWREDLPAFQAWCRKRTHEGKYWVPFAKGGEYSPYYADIHLVVNWKNEGAEIKNFADPKSGKTYSRPQNTEFYFRPGVTWPKVTISGLSVRPFHAGQIFSVGGLACFSDQFSDMYYWLNATNTKIYELLMRLMGAWHNWEIGQMKYLPFALHNSICEKCRHLSEDLITIISRYYSNDITSYTYSNMQIINQNKRTELYQKIQDKLKLMNFHIIVDHLEKSENLYESVLNYLKEDVRFTWENDELSPTEYASLVFENTLAVGFGRLDARIALHASLTPSLPDPFDPLPVCPPAMLVGTDGLPARQDNIASEAWLRARPNAITLPSEPFRSQKITVSEYPLEIPWDGILVDDPEDSRDIIARLRAVLTYLHGTNADAKERELCAELAVRDLREYLRKPSLFFNAHLKRYSKSRRKAPIYWPLQTRDGRYTLWLYYPRLTADTLYGCINILETKIRLEQRKLELARIDLEKSEGKAERTRVEELTEFIAALTEMKEELERVASLPYKPNLDDGVQITAAPLWRFFRLPSWQKELKVTWEKLENGDYDWAHLAYSIWPDRVREKCRNDRSLAIAHGLESICEQKTLTDTDEKKKQGRKAKPALEPDEELEYDED